MENVTFTNQSEGGVNTSPSDQGGNYNEGQNYSEKSNSAMHFFLYLISFFSLGFVSLGVGSIMYQIINKNIPDSLSSYAYYLDSFQQTIIKFGIASLIVAGPVYFVVSFLINKYLREGRIYENSGVRKWTTYIILFIASAVVIGDLIALVFKVLDGSAIEQFVLKVIVDLVIAGLILGYYFWDMRKRDMVNRTFLGNKIFAISVIAIIVVVFISSFFVIENPFETRNKKIDEQTISQLSNINSGVQSYYEKNKKLPVSLKSLDKFYVDSVVQQNSSLTYTPLGATSYKLCANFKSARLTAKNNDGSFVDPGTYMDQEWSHGKGNVCFTKDINAENDNLSDQPSPVSSRIEPMTVSPTSAAIVGVSLADARRKAQIASIKATMSSNMPMGILCRDGNGEVLSGNLGDPMCKGDKTNGSDTARWPSIDACGPNPSETKWTVFGGNTDNWNFTLTCANMPDCNGPENALCDGVKCNFGGTCQ